MNSLAKAIKEHLDHNQVQYHEHECENADAGFTAAFSGNTSQVWLGVQVYEEERRLYFSAYNGVKVPPERLQAVHEFTVRANYGLPIGGFWLDENNELRFAVTTALADLEPTDCWMRTYICNTLSTYDRFFPAVCQVVYAGVAPAEALESMGEPTEQQIIQTLSHLFGHAKEHMQEPFEGLDDDQKPDDPDDADTGNRPLSFQLPSLPKIVAKISPEDIAEIQREIEGKGHQPDRKEADGNE